MEYKDFFSPKTLKKLNQQSADNLKNMLGDKTLMQVLMSSMEVLQYVALIEKDYIPELEQLAVKVVKEMHPIIDQEDITIDAKIVSMGEVNDMLRDEENEETEEDFSDIEPSVRRRIINSISQGAAVKGSFAFYLFKENIDKINDQLVDKYGDLLKGAFGIYDDDNAIAMLMAQLAQGQKAGGGASEVDREEDGDILIKARAINFPMLVHEIIKGLYELVSLQGFADLGAEQAKRVAGSVDKLSNEPLDLRYGKFIYSAINDIVSQSNYDNPNIREYFLAEIYKLDESEFLPFIENAINNELTPQQKKWVDDTLRDINDDLKADAYDDLGIDESKTNPISFIKQRLKEYSEKFINSTIERWKEEDSSINDFMARKLINKFDQVKQGIESKLDIVVLPDELKQDKNYLNLDKYSYDDLEKLIRSIPENPDKIKKAAIKKFIKDGTTKDAARSYVSRFMNKRNDLKVGFQSGIEELGLSADDIKEHIPDRLYRNENFLDPGNYKFEELEQLLDTVFPSYAKADNSPNTADTNADKIYEKNGIEIYKADAKNKCIEYNPTNPETSRKMYSWCVAQPGNSMYDNYRFKEDAPTFYIVFDRSRSSDKKNNNIDFIDPFHAFVVQVYKDGETYVVTDASNRGDKKADSWEEIPNKTDMPSELWDKFKGLKEYFKPIPLSSTERARKLASGKNLSANEFKELSQDEKIMYTLGKAQRNSLTDEILEILPKYKIKYEGRSTTLANVAIDGGQTFSYKQLEDNEALAKRYAIFRFRHTDYSKKPIPLPFVKFLDLEAQQKFADTFEENHTFELLEKFFDPEIVKRYVDKQSKSLDYLPSKAFSYIKNPKLLAFYKVFNIMTKNWSFGSSTFGEEADLSDIREMKVQEVNPNPLTAYNWLKDLSNEERKTIIKVVKQYTTTEGKELDDKYATLLYALPLVVQDGSNDYVLLPDNLFGSGSDITFYLIDTQGKVKQRYKAENLEIKNTPIYTGYVIDYNQNKIWNIIDINDIKKV